MDSAAYQRIVASEPRAVAQLLRLYGYDAEPTAYNLRNFTAVYGHKPLPFSNTTGDAPGEKKTSLAEILDMVAKGVTTVGNIVNIVKGKPLVEQSQTQVALGTNTPKDDSDRILGIDKNLFYGLVILITVTVAYFLWRKK